MSWKSRVVLCMVVMNILTVKCEETRISGAALQKGGIKDETFRPQLHYSVRENWSNDPNGMVYLDGEYHLYYQYHPYDTVWGPMHWGHAVSPDMVSWTDLPIALYPDELGTIYSGSAVPDFENTAGFQTGNNTPIIAIFTHAGASQQQSIAFSNDKGRTYTKFEGNPVISNTDIQDFRDPKVIRYRDSWVLVLAAGNRVVFYGSQDLKTWEHLSEFGNDPSQGAHGGTWECPLIMETTIANETVWVLIVSIGGGGPNGGSVTQYFIGDFDGRTFHSSQVDPLWMDWGLDNYASMSFSNDPQNRNIVIGWMSNLQYSGSTPSVGWRGQFTLPRVLEVKLASGQLRLQSTPVPELNILSSFYIIHMDTRVVGADEVIDLKSEDFLRNPLMHAVLHFDTENMSVGASLSICFLNSLRQEICTGFDKGRERSIFLNRELSGRSDFHPEFARRASALRQISSPIIQFEIYLDVSAIEVFVDSGLTCMTALFYPDEPFQTVEIRHHANGNPSSTFTILPNGQVEGLKSIYEI
nr:putative GH32 family protein [Pogonognathellus flavescens]